MDKYDNIIKECRDLVESLPAGATVPSVRRLMKRFGVSQLVITQAMNEMKKAGLIVSQVGRGTFKAPADNRENCPNGVVSLLLPDWQSSFTAAISRLPDTH
jgi:DNA-binding GntR family transcriptional regulator